MSEITKLHKPFIEFLKSNNILFVYKNWNNHKRQADDGRSDFIIPLTGITIYVEFKTKEKYLSKNNGLSEKQIDWKEYLLTNNHVYLLTWNLSDAINLVNYYKKTLIN